MAFQTQERPDGLKMRFVNTVQVCFMYATCNLGLIKVMWSIMFPTFYSCTRPLPRVFHEQIDVPDGHDTYSNIHRMKLIIDDLKSCHPIVFDPASVIFA